jgi:hypothetical protein
VHSNHASVPENPEFRGPHGGRYRSRNQLDEWAFNAKHLAHAKPFRRLTHLGKDRLVEFDLVVRNFNHQQAEPNFSQIELVFDVLVERYENVNSSSAKARSLPLVTPPPPSHFDYGANLVPFECRSNTRVDAFV